jgi:hypothetical protein
MKNQSISLNRQLLLSFFFATAMAYLESAVVVYLRLLYYPEGFEFPLAPIPPFILWVEIGREAATIIMLYTVARFLARNAMQAFAWFCFNFAVWDLWYYGWLKIFLNWPASLLDWDVLFLIPLPWISPVLAPVLVSLALLLTALLILWRENRNQPFHFSRMDWLAEIFLGLVIIVSFLLQLDRVAANQVPADYPWWLFLAALFVGLALFFYRYFRSNPDQSG